VVAIASLMAYAPAGTGAVALPGRSAGGTALPGLRVCGGQVGCDAGTAADGETFGTAVQFVRNPQEAARIAGAEGKLTFLLHVSGNFEDARFT
jgi:hypothetical protein